MNSSDKSTSAAKGFETITPIISANDEQNFIRLHGHQKAVRLDRHLLARLCPLGVIDTETLKMIQVLRLHDCLDYTVSCSGSAVLLRSLIQPSTDLDLIQSKQESLNEIKSNDRLRGTLQDLVLEYSSGENALYQFFNKGLYALSPYRVVREAKKAAVNLTKILPSISAPASLYLGNLIGHLRAYAGSSVDQMMSGAVYQTFGGLKSGKEVSWATPKLQFIPRRFSRWTAVGPAVAAAPLIQQSLGVGPSLSPLLLHVGIAVTAVSAFYSLFIKPVRDTGKFIEPFRKKCVTDPAFNRAIDAVGMIDELLSFHRYAEESPYPTALPKIADEPHHIFEATNMRNPVLANENAVCVPNDICLNGAKLTFISGPNSGGKTTICKSIVHNQLLGQIGCYVLAEKAAINIADRISYQAPKFDGLQDDEGRFGTELGRTRDIFYATSSRSLVILDELAEGTTVEEKMQESHGILSDFYTIGNNTLLVTHNHSLVDRFMEDSRGQCLMVEFEEDRPTYRIKPGISRVSHADRIAKKIGFSQKDRHRYLKEKGYL